MKPGEFVVELSLLLLLCVVSVSSVLRLFIAFFQFFSADFLLKKYEMQNFAHDFHSKVAVVARCLSLYTKFVQINQSLTDTYLGHESVNITTSLKMYKFR